MYCAINFCMSFIMIQLQRFSESFCKPAMCTRLHFEAHCFPFIEYLRLTNGDSSSGHQDAR